MANSIPYSMYLKNASPSITMYGKPHGSENITFAPQ